MRLNGVGVTLPICDWRPLINPSSRLQFISPRLATVGETYINGFGSLHLRKAPRIFWRATDLAYFDCSGTLSLPVRLPDGAPVMRWVRRLYLDDLARARFEFAIFSNPFRTYPSPGLEASAVAARFWEGDVRFKTRGNVSQLPLWKVLHEGVARHFELMTAAPGTIIEQRLVDVLDPQIIVAGEMLSRALPAGAVSLDEHGLLWLAHEPLVLSGYAHRIDVFCLISLPGYFQSRPDAVKRHRTVRAHIGALHADLQVLAHILRAQDRVVDCKEELAKYLPELCRSLQACPPDADEDHALVRHLLGALYKFQANAIAHVKAGLMQRTMLDPSVRDTIREGLTECLKDRRDEPKTAAPVASVKHAGRPRNRPGTPTVGVITALEHEFVAVKLMVPDAVEKTMPGRGAGRRFIIGEIPARSGSHRVALTLTPKGNSSAAARAATMLKHFPDMTMLIMTGIAGGVPHPTKPSEHVRLGDVVVCDQGGVVKYDYGKESVGKFTTTYLPRPPSAILVEAFRLLKVEELLGNRPWERYIQQLASELNRERPGEDTDVLQTSRKPFQRILHPADPDRRIGFPKIFSGPIAAADRVLKNPVKRDALRDGFGVKAVEMEGFGIAEASWECGAGYLVVRGICDYCDSKKNDYWQEYAAIVAASYTRALLESMPPDTKR